MKNQKKKSFSLRVFLCLLAVLLAVYVAFGVYVNDYYHADPAAEDCCALRFSDTESFTYSTTLLGIEKEDFAFPIPIPGGPP